MISISHIPLCYGNSVPMATRVKPQFLLCLTEFMFGMEVYWDNRHQLHTLVAMATKVR